MFRNNRIIFFGMIICLVMFQSVGGMHENSVLPKSNTGVVPTHEATQGHSATASTSMLSKTMYNKAVTGMKSALTSAQDFAGDFAASAGSTMQSVMQSISGVGMQLSSNQYVAKAGDIIGSGVLKVSSAASDAYTKIVNSKAVYSAKLAVSPKEQQKVKDLSALGEVTLTNDLFGDAPEVDPAVRNQKKAALDLVGSQKKDYIDKAYFDHRVRGKRTEYKDKKAEQAKSDQEPVETKPFSERVVEILPESMQKTAGQFVKNNIQHVLTIPSQDVKGKPIKITVDVLNLKKDLGAVKQKMEMDGDVDGLKIIDDLLENVDYLANHPTDPKALPVFVEKFTYLYGSKPSPSVFNVNNALDPALREVIFIKNQILQKKLAQVEPSGGQSLSQSPEESHQPLVARPLAGHSAPASKAQVVKTDFELMNEFDDLGDFVYGVAEQMSPEQQAAWTPKFEKLASIQGKISQGHVDVMQNLYNELKSAGF